MAIEWRRIPPALIVSFAADALRLVVANMLRPTDRMTWVILVAFDVIGPTLAAVGYAQLARRLVDRAKTGAMLAAVASATFVVVLLAAFVSWSFWRLPAFVPILIGLGLAAMVPRPWFVLAVPAIALPIASLVVPDFYLVWELAWIVTALAIVAAASSGISALPPRVAASSIDVARPGHRFAVASLVLFGVSLCLPAFAVTNKPLFGGGGHDQNMWGFQCLIYGWIVIPGWVANPLVLAAAILHAYRKDRVAFPLACVAVGSAVSAPFLLTSFVEVRFPHVGYVAWLASMVCFAIATRRADQMKKSGNSSAVGSTAYSERSVLPSARSTSSSIRNLPV